MINKVHIRKYFSNVIRRARLMLFSLYDCLRKMILFGSIRFIVQAIYEKRLIETTALEIEKRVIDERKIVKLELL